jgi:hypothetical protein
MPVLEFDAERVKKIVEHVKSATSYPPLYGAEIGPAVLLVGDQGVYLMPNATPPLMADGTVGEPGKAGRRYVAYAKGINPDADEFDAWWEAKQNSFGGDDGVESLPLAEIETAMDMLQPGKPLRIEITDKFLRVMSS